MMHKTFEFVDSSDMGDAESKAEDEFEEAAPQSPACAAAILPERKTTLKREQSKSDISPMLMFGQHRGETYKNAIEADPQYYFLRKEPVEAWSLPDVVLGMGEDQLHRLEWGSDEANLM